VQDRVFTAARTHSSDSHGGLAALEGKCSLHPAHNWVFASKRYRGRRPIWGQAILRKYIRPVAERVGIEKRFGWHTFRHTYSTLLRSVGTEFKVMQELLRHSSLRSTLDVYTQAISPAKHAAQAAVLALVFAPETPRAHSRKRCQILNCRAPDNGSN
jgi:integrase